MERGSNKHGGRIDDELDREVRGLVQGREPVDPRVEPHRQKEDTQDIHAAEDRPV